MSNPQTNISTSFIKTVDQSSTDSRAVENSKPPSKKSRTEFNLSVTFNPTLPNIRQVISSNLNILRSSQAFSSPPCISYRRRKNLRDTSQVTPPPAKKTLLELSVVTEIGPRHVFSLQREPCLTLFSLPTNKDVVRHHRVICSSSNLVYMM